MKKYQKTSHSIIKGVILHGPVSDREYAMISPFYEKNLKIAKSLRRQKRNINSLMPKESWDSKDIPITCNRWLSLNEKMNFEDMFSSDLTFEEMSQKIGHLKGYKSLIVFCGGDEYVPSKIDKKKLLTKICKCCGAHGFLFQGADHYLKKKDGKYGRIFVEKCMEFIGKVYGRGESLEKVKILICDEEMYESPREPV